MASKLVISIQSERKTFTQPNIWQFHCQWLLFIFVNSGIIQINIHQFRLFSHSLISRSLSMGWVCIQLLYGRSRIFSKTPQECKNLPVTRGRFCPVPNVSVLVVQLLVNCYYATTCRFQRSEVLCEAPRSVIQHANVSSKHFASVPSVC